MPTLSPERPKILFLYSDTGGGHRSAAEAIIEALRLEYGDAIDIEKVDFLKEYAPKPFNRLPAMYPGIVRAPRIWQAGYHLSNGDRRVRMLLAAFRPVVRRSSFKQVAERKPDLIVSVHPLANDAALRSLGTNRPPFITVVTDLVTVHAFWYTHGIDLCIVPSEEAYRRAIRFGLQPDQVRQVGLPVAERFCKIYADKTTLRTRFGWPNDRRLILLVGGGEGMGPIESTAHAIAEKTPEAALIIIAGRNQALKDRLKAHNWPIPVFIYGFVREMPEFMYAADILVTKAGPGTISEALISGLPMVLYSRLPGQEDGNVDLVVSGGAGIWAPRPKRVAAAIRTWLDNPSLYRQAQEACQHLARPRAARQIARMLVDYLPVHLPTLAVASEAREKENS
jgi:1,2-diacylglycerol 3-beta-galactosyltransferase